MHGLAWLLLCLNLEEKCLWSGVLLVSSEAVGGTTMAGQTVADLVTSFSRSRCREWLSVNQWAKGINIGRGWGVPRVASRTHAQKRGARIAFLRIIAHMLLLYLFALLCILTASGIERIRKKMKTSKIMAKSENGAGGSENKWRNGMAA